MTHVLVTFLGAPDSGRPPSLRKRRGYQEVIYGFGGNGSPSDAKHYPQRFFPLALRDYLDESGKPVDKLVVFGTPGSAWDEFLLYVGIPSLRLADIDALRREIERNAVEGTRLQAEWADRVKGALRLPKGVQLKVIKGYDKVIKGYAEETGEQVEMITRLAEAAEQATEVTFDVTHGLRYLPLLGSLAAYVVNSKDKVPVNVWYGAYDMRKANGLGEEIAPAIELGGLSRIVDWLAAFKNFEWDGDYWAFAEALKAKGATQAEEALAAHLYKAAFFERLGRFQEAKDSFEQFEKGVGALRTIAPSAYSMIKLFQDDLNKRIRFADLSGEHLYEHQCALARHHLNHEDVVHAAIWGREAAVTRAALDYYQELKKPAKLSLSRENAIRHYKVREEASSILRSKSADLRAGPFERIRLIRNALAHAVDGMQPASNQVEEDVEKALVSAEDCKNALERYFNEFGLPSFEKRVSE